MPDPIFDLVHVCVCAMQAAGFISERLNTLKSDLTIGKCTHRILCVSCLKLFLELITSDSNFTPPPQHTHTHTHRSYTDSICQWKCH